MNIKLMTEFFGKSDAIFNQSEDPSEIAQNLIKLQEHFGGEFQAADAVLTIPVNARSGDKRNAVLAILEV